MEALDRFEAGLDRRGLLRLCLGVPWRAWLTALADLAKSAVFRSPHLVAHYIRKYNQGHGADNSSVWAFPGGLHRRSNGDTSQTVRSKGGGSSHVMLIVSEVAPDTEEWLPAA